MPVNAETAPDDDVEFEFDQGLHEVAAAVGCLNGCLLASLFWLMVALLTLWWRS